MAFAHRETFIANPGKKSPGKANRMTAKQIRYFGTKRQKSALKAKRNKPKAHHRPRTKPKAKRNTAKRTVSRKKPSSTQTKRKRNFGEIVSLMPLSGNPARKGKKVAATKKNKKKKNTSASRAGKSKRNYTKVMHAHRRRHGVRNPGMFGQPIDWIEGGIGVTAGVLGSRGLPQLFMASSNTGVMGYLMNAASTAALAVLSHMFFPKRKTLTASIIAGGAGALLARVVGDYSLLGSYSNQVASTYGMGDYLMTNFIWPQRLPDGLHSAQVAIPNGWAPTTVVAANSANVAGGVGSLIGSPIY